MAITIRNRALPPSFFFIKPEWVVNIKETGQILLVDYFRHQNLNDHHHRFRQVPA